MSTITGQAGDLAQNVSPVQSGASSSFASLGDFYNTVKEPEYLRKIQKKYHEDLGIMALLMTNGQEGFTARDTENYHYEATRSFVDGTATANSAIASTDTGAEQFNETNNSVRLGDVVMIEGKVPAIVTSRATNSFTATPKTSTWGITVSSGAAVTYFVAFNEFQKGTDQPTQYLIDNVERVETKLSIMKDRYTMTGSEMTDRTWIEGLNGTGAFIYYGEEKGYMRFKAYEEMKLIFDSESENSNLSGYNGTKGLFTQITERGNVVGDYLSTLSDVEDVTEVLDQASGPAQYAAFLNSRQFNLMQNLISDATGLVSYGLFDNDKEKMVDFKFKGLSVSGYDFFLKKWNLLNNPQLGGKNKVYKGAMIPMGQVKTQEGNIPNLSILYKKLGSYSRKFETQITGFGNGVGNDASGFDGINVDYRSECGLRGAAMNSFVLIK